MKLRTTAATALAASAAVLALGAVPANAATTTLRATSLTLKSSTTAAHYGQLITLTAHLGATAHNRVVEIDLGHTVLKKAAVDRHGNLSVQVKAHYNSNFTAKFAGDSADKPAVAGVHVNTAAAISAKFIGGSVRAGSAYHYYSNAKGQIPTISIAVAPGKGGENITRYIQVLQNGSWVNAPVAHWALYANSTLVLDYKSLPAGFTFREYVVYGGDSVNTGAVRTGWQYAEVTK